MNFNKERKSISISDYRAKYYNLIENGAPFTSGTTPYFVYQSHTTGVNDITFLETPVYALFKHVFEYITLNFHC